jgi:hypothetical protein
MRERRSNLPEEIIGLPRTIVLRDAAFGAAARHDTEGDHIRVLLS